jgi:5,6-dimethylbenzimidazole synthase
MILVETPDRRNAIRRLHEAANVAAVLGYPSPNRDEYLKLKLAGFDAAPVHLAVFCHEGTTQGHGLGRKTMPEMLRYSCVAMISTMWLVARARGVGTGWVSTLQTSEVTHALDVPDTWPLIGYLLLGWPESKHLEPELERAGW